MENIVNFRSNACQLRKFNECFVWLNEVNSEIIACRDRRFKNVWFWKL